MHLDMYALFGVWTVNTNICSALNHMATGIYKYKDAILNTYVTQH